MDSALEWLKKERAASELSIIMVVGLPNSGKSSIINAFKLAAKKQGAPCIRCIL
jgi:ribosome biogenesis GTPase A